MEALFLEYKNELFATIICLIVLAVLKYFGTKAIRKVGKISDLNLGRTTLIIKYATAGLTGVGALALIFIWGVDIGLVFSSVFAVIGIAFFAQWSILSNITAGVILFFSFPFKIGDKIKIMDKEIDLPGEVYLIEDIRAFHIHLRRSNGELFTYPNNLMLQKAIGLATSFEKSTDSSDIL
ncbi:MAG TPA: mechanosensitive ion channel domain-containing protein [Arenibacter sp.]|nr:mechanosensitive ion channel domain-containing protein [Arenibacter sp.]